MCRVRVCGSLKIDSTAEEERELRLPVYVPAITLSAVNLRHRFYFHTVHSIPVSIVIIDDRIGTCARKRAFVSVCV